MKTGCSQFGQRGITLITSLLMLVLITILALSVMKTSVFEERWRETLGTGLGL
jgi:Tfp pilus assembly protein PilX